jgi:hypothetical protein
MTRDDLWAIVYAACQQYGRTTDHTDDCIHALIDSLVVANDEALCSLCRAMVMTPVIRKTNVFCSEECADEALREEGTCQD